MGVNPIRFVYYLIASIAYYLSADHGNTIAPHGSQWALIFDALLAALESAYLNSGQDHAHCRRRLVTRQPSSVIIVGIYMRVCIRNCWILAWSPGIYWCFHTTALKEQSNSTLAQVSN
jgi:hypothetical protein